MVEQEQAGKIMHVEVSTPDREWYNGVADKVTLEKQGILRRNILQIRLGNEAETIIVSKPSLSVSGEGVVVHAAKARYKQSVVRR